MIAGFPRFGLPRMLDGRGFGNLCRLREKGIYGREIPLATIVRRRRDRAGEMAAQEFCGAKARRRG